MTVLGINCLFFPISSKHRLWVSCNSPLSSISGPATPTMLHQIPIPSREPTASWVAYSLVQETPNRLENTSYQATSYPQSHCLRS